MNFDQKIEQLEAKLVGLTPKEWVRQFELGIKPELAQNKLVENLIADPRYVWAHLIVNSLTPAIPEEEGW